MFITVKQLSKSYGTNENKSDALKAIDLEVAKGEFIAIVGTSGSGKSTLLHMLGGLDTPDSGSIHISDQEITGYDEDEMTVFRRRSIGFVFQHYNLIPMLNVYENIALPAELDGVQADVAHIEQLLETLGLRDKKWQLPSQLSGGQQQRVAIARALAMRPQLVLADEPTGNLDSKMGLEVILLLKQMNRMFTQTIIMITHNEELAAMTDRIIRIEDGSIISPRQKEESRHER